MTIADEMGSGLGRVTITLADARPELIWNQLTSGSNSMHSIFIPVRVAAAIARHQLVEAAALALQEPAYDLTVVGGQVTSPSGGSIGLGALANKATGHEQPGGAGQPAV